MSAATDRCRKALQRERERLGLVRAELWLDEDQIGRMLVRGGLLDPTRADDRRAIEAALMAQIEILCRLPE